MPFRFKLASLLRIREIREDLERARLEAAAARLQIEKDALTEIRERDKLSRVAFLAADQLITGSELMFQLQCSHTSLKAEMSAQERYEEASRVCEHRRNIYHAALRDFDVLKKLEQRQHKQFLLREARMDQQRLDEVFTLVSRHIPRQPLPTE